MNSLVFDINSTTGGADVCAGKKLIKTRLSTVVPSVCSLIVARRVQSIDWIALCQPIWRSTDGIKVNRLLREVIKRLWEKDLARESRRSSRQLEIIERAKRNPLCLSERRLRFLSRRRAMNIYTRQSDTYASGQYVTSRNLLRAAIADGR